MERQFYATSNFSTLHQVLNEGLQSKYGVSFEQVSKKKELFKIMDHVYKRYHNRANSVTSLNKKVIDVALPLIEEEIQRKHAAVQSKLTDPVPMQQGTSGMGGVDGTLLQRNSIDQYAQALPMPVAQGSRKRDVDLASAMEQRSAQRDQDITGMGLAPPPPPRAINFQSDISDSPENAEQRYQEALQRRQHIPPPQMGSDMLVPGISGHGDGQGGRQGDMERGAGQRNSIQMEVSRAEEAHRQMTMQGGADRIDRQGGQLPGSGRAVLISDLEQREQVVHPNEQVAPVLEQSGIGDMESGVMLSRNEQEVVLEQSNNPQELFAMNKEYNEEKERMLNAGAAENYQRKEEIIVPPPIKQRYKTHYITIDSRDRDLFTYPNPNHFQVKFGPSSSSRVQGIYRDTANNVIYDATNVFIDGERGATLSNVYNNIRYVQCVQVIVPHTPTYVCGVCPPYFNSYQVDRNETIGATGQFKSYPYGPIHQVNDATNSGMIGLYTNVLDEPYLLLYIDELDQTYNGTNTSNRNAFAKLVHDNYYGTLTAFVQMRTSEHEPFYYEPFPLGKLDKMTLRLLKCNNLPYDFGRDKIYINKFEEGDGWVSIGSTKAKTTKITIVTACSQYDETDTEDHSVHYSAEGTGAANTAIQHCLRPGNKIYLYDTFPCETDVIKFQQNIRVLDIDTEIDGSSGEYTVTAHVDNADDEQVAVVQFERILKTGDYLFLNDNPYVVTGFESGTGGVTIKWMNGSTPPTLPSELGSIQLAFGRKNVSGIKSHVKNTFNYVDGWRVCSTPDPEDSGITDAIATSTFEIDFPYEWLPDRLKGLGDGLGDTHYETFFIKHQLQISYTFKIQTVERDFEQLKADLI